MKKFIIESMEAIATFLFIISIMGGAMLGFYIDQTSNSVFPIGTIVTTLLFFFNAVIIFGVLFLFLQIEKNTRLTLAELKKIGKDIIK